MDPLPTEVLAYFLYVGMLVPKEGVRHVPRREHVLRITEISELQTASGFSVHCAFAVLVQMSPFSSS